MTAQLIAISKPVIDECPTTGAMLAYCARVSNPGNQTNTLTAPRLLRYLAKHAHWSPFEMASMTIKITTTRDIARQILRHRSFAFQEFSQRYAAVDAGLTKREARMQDPINRQASHDTSDASLSEAWAEAQQRVEDAAMKAYKWALSAGIAKEQARAVLPEGMTPSVLYVAGTIRSWIHYVQIRTEAGTQKEHRDIANECKEILLREFPSLSEILGADNTAD